MGTLAEQFAAVFRDYVTDGVPASGEHEPVKSEVRAIGPAIERALGLGGLAGVDVTYATRAELNADLAHDAGATALVYADATDANNDLYVKTGASGSGAWTLTTILHDVVEGVVSEKVAELVDPKVALAQEWAENPEDDAVTGYPGEYSALHHSAKASAQRALAAEWAANPEDDEVTGVPGGYSAKHYATKSGASATESGAWAKTAVDTEVPGNPGEYSAKHYAAKAGAAATAALENRYFGSVMFPEENGESPDALNQAFFTLPNSKTALTGAGDLAFWYGDSSILFLWDCPVDQYNGLNRGPTLIGTNTNLSSRSWYLNYGAKGAVGNPATHSLAFGIRGETGASPEWLCNTAAVLPATLSRMAIKVVRSGDSMQIDVLDIETGIWYRGPAVAKPAGFVGAPVVTHDLAIGNLGIHSGAFPNDFTAASGNNTPQNLRTLRGSARDVLIADKALSDADVEAIVYSGADPVAQVTAPLCRLYAPLATSGAVSLSVTSSRVAMANGLTLFGSVLPGPTMKRQGANYFTLDALRQPAFVAREQGRDVAVAQLTGKTTGLTGRLQARIVDRANRIVRDWHNVDFPLTGTAFSCSVNVPCPAVHRFEIQLRFTGSPTVIAKTHSNMQAGPVVAFWGQSEGAISVLGSYSSTGQPTTLNVQPEGETSTVNFVLPGTTSIVKFGRQRPGLMGDTMLNIANYVRRRTQEPVLFACHLISGTSLRDLMDDTKTDTGRQWADELNCHAYPVNRGANGEYIVTGHVKVGWEAADNVISYSEFVNAPWYQGRGWNGAALVGINQVDHFLYDGSMSMTAVSVELGCNRITSPNAAITDFSNEADQRASQRNWGHRLGYLVGPPQSTHKMEGEIAAGGIPPSPATHPEGNDWEGGLEMSFANAEAALMAIGKGGFPGHVFLESVRVGSAANKVIAVFGNPRPFPGEGLADPNVGYSTTTQRATVPAPVKLRTKKAGGNPKWGFEAKINTAGTFAITNVTAATILNAREVELTLSANYVVGQTQIAYQPGSPGNYGSATVTQEDWRSGQLFFTGPYWTAGKEPGWAVSGSNQAATLA